MNLWQSILTIVISIIGSSGLWAFIQAKQDKKDAKTRMLVGLAHDRILYLGESYINRGWITMDEYENCATTYSILMRSLAATAAPRKWWTFAKRCRFARSISSRKAWFKVQRSSIFPTF